MTLDAQQAYNLTLATIDINDRRRLDEELMFAERQIRSRISAEIFNLSYNAKIIGNPSGNPADDAVLTELQILFRDHFVNDGYRVTLDPDNGNWFLSWEDVGSEIAVTVYSVRTTVTPGAISQQTIDAINNFFGSLIPSATSRVILVDTTPSSGGDIPESDFGAPDSTFYEYLTLAEQQDDTDHSFNLKAHLRATGLGYVDDSRVTGVGSLTNTTSPLNTLDVSNGVVTVTVTVGGVGGALDLVNAINFNPTLSAAQIKADVNGSDVLIINELGGNLIVTNNVGDVLGEIFGLTSPQVGVITDNTEVYKIS